MIYFFFLVDFFFLGEDLLLGDVFAFLLGDVLLVGDAFLLLGGDVLLLGPALDLLRCGELRNPSPKKSSTVFLEGPLLENLGGAMGDLRLLEM